MKPFDFLLKKIWLGWLIAETIFGFATEIISPAEESLAVWVWVGLFIQLFFLTCGYFFAYRKPGTVFLIFCISTMPLGLNHLIRDWSADPSLLSTLPVLLSAVYYALTIMVWRINEKMQMQQVLASDTYQNAILSLRTATNTDDLKVKFKTAIKKQSRRFRRALKQEYRKTISEMETA